MFINKTIEEIRKTRHEISVKYHHDTKELLGHYKQMEKKYADRIYDSEKAHELLHSKLKHSVAD